MCTADAQQTYHILHLLHLPRVDHLRKINQSIGHVMTLCFLMGIVVLNLQGPKSATG